MNSEQHTRPFAALLSQKTPRRALGKSALFALTVHGVMLGGALCLPSTQAALPKKEPELSALLLELPKATEPSVTSEPDVEPSGGSPAPAPTTEVVAPKPRAKEPAPRVAAVKPVAKDKPAEEKPKEKVPEVAPTPAPAIAVAAPEPTPAPQPVSATPVVASANTQTAAATVAVGGTGSGGSGSGPGSGSGAGAARSGAGNGGGGTTVLPFGDGMSRPVLISKVDPTYTREALTARVEGAFIAKCVITVRGELTNCRVVKGLPFMDQSVLSALSKWRYSPVLYQGKPASVEYVVSVRLVLP